MMDATKISDVQVASAIKKSDGMLQNRDAAEYVLSIARSAYEIHRINRRDTTLVQLERAKRILELNTQVRNLATHDPGRVSDLQRIEEINQIKNLVFLSRAVAWDAFNILALKEDQQTKEGIPELFFTEKAVKSSEAAAAVPKGYRMARPDEVALNWKEKREFRKELDDITSGVWTDQTGLNSTGPHRIDENGKFVRITEDEYKTLDTKDRSRHYLGPGLVVLAGFNWDWDGRLSVSTSFGFEPEYAARVAYVALETGAPQNLLRPTST